MVERGSEYSRVKAADGVLGFVKTAYLDYGAGGKTLKKRKPAAAAAPEAKGAQRKKARAKAKGRPKQATKQTRREQAAARRAPGPTAAKDVDHGAKDVGLPATATGKHGSKGVAPPPATTARGTPRPSPRGPATSVDVCAQNPLATRINNQRPSARGRTTTAAAPTAPTTAPPLKPNAVVCAGCAGMHVPAAAADRENSRCCARCRLLRPKPAEPLPSFPGFGQACTTPPSGERGHAPAAARVVGKHGRVAGDPPTAATADAPGGDAPGTPIVMGPGDDKACNEPLLAGDTVAAAPAMQAPDDKACNKTLLSTAAARTCCNSRQKDKHPSAVTANCSGSGRAPKQAPKAATTHVPQQLQEPSRHPQRPAPASAAKPRASAKQVSQADVGRSPQHQRQAPDGDTDGQASTQCSMAENSCEHTNSEQQCPVPHALQAGLINVGPTEPTPHALIVLEQTLLQLRPAAAHETVREKAEKLEGQLRCLEVLERIVTTQTSTFLTTESTLLAKAAAALVRVVAANCHGQNSRDPDLISLENQIEDQARALVQVVLHTASSSDLGRLAPAPFDQSAVRRELLSLVANLAEATRSWRIILCDQLLAATDRHIAQVNTAVAMAYAGGHHLKKRVPVDLCFHNAMPAMLACLKEAKVHLLPDRQFQVTDLTEKSKQLYPLLQFCIRDGNARP